MITETLKKVEKSYLQDRTMDVNPGDTVQVSYKIQEGGKTRIQNFKGTVIQTKNSGIAASFTLRKSSGNNVYVERVFALHSPLIDSIEIVKRGHVRRAKLYYLRERTGKSTRIKEKK